MKVRPKEGECPNDCMGPHVVVEETTNHYLCNVFGHSAGLVALPKAHWEPAEPRWEDVTDECIENHGIWHSDHARVCVYDFEAQDKGYRFRKVQMRDKLLREQWAFKIERKVSE